MTDSPLRAKGRAMRRNLMGAAYADKLDQQLYTDPIMEKFAALTQETVFGTLWTRPGLDLKTRTLICVVSDTATGRTPELKLHIRFACNHGWTEDELGYEVTVVKDATADYSDKEMYAALEINIPNYASAIVTTKEIVGSISSL